MKNLNGHEMCNPESMFQYYQQQKIKIKKSMVPYFQNSFLCILRWFPSSNPKFSFGTYTCFSSFSTSSSTSKNPLHKIQEQSLLKIKLQFLFSREKHSRGSFQEILTWCRAKRRCSASVSTSIKLC